MAACTVEKVRVCRALCCLILYRSFYFCVHIVGMKSARTKQSEKVRPRAGVPLVWEPVDLVSS